MRSCDSKDCFAEFTLRYQRARNDKWRTCRCEEQSDEAIPDLGGGRRLLRYARNDSGGGGDCFAEFTLRYRRARNDKWLHGR